MGRQISDYPLKARPLAYLEGRLVFHLLNMPPTQKPAICY